jgi:hypothetical protein
MGKTHHDHSGALSEIVACLILATTVVSFNWEIVANGKVPFFGDLVAYFYPMRFILYESFQNGELPLWSRNLSMGFPFLANPQSAVFYPLHVVFSFLPFLTSIRFLFVVHHFVAAAGSYLLLREWRYPHWLALTGAVLFSFGGTLISLTNLLDHFQSAVWLPWVLLFGERAIRTGFSRDFLLLTMTLLVQVLAGSPEIYAMSVGILCVNSLRLKAERLDITWRQVIGILLGPNLLVAGLAMVQILPSVELFRHSWRFQAIPEAQAMMWSLNPLSVANLFLLDKEVNLHSPQGVNFFFARQRPLILSLYAGAILLPGIGLWLVVSSRKERAITLALVAAVFILALGSYTPLYLLLSSIPLLEFIRFPEKFCFVGTILLQRMVLTSLSRFFYSARLSLWTTGLALFLPFLAICVIYLVFRLNMPLLVGFVAWAKHSGIHDVSTLRIAPAVLVHLERQILLTFGIFMLLWLWKAGKLEAALCALLLFGLTFLDLYSAHQPYQFALDPVSVYEKPMVLNVSNKTQFRLFYNHELSYLDPDSYSFTARPFPETVSSVKAALMPNTGVFQGFDYMQELESLARIPYHLFLRVAGQLPPEHLYRLLGALNVKYLSSLQPLGGAGVRLVTYLPDYPLWLYEVDSAVPRAYLAEKIIVEADPTRSIERLASPGFDPLKDVILQTPLAAQETTDLRGEARISKYENSLVRIEASLNRPGILVLADSFYPGWEVYVDGKKSQIQRANFFFRGVLLPAGQHRVEFKYEPYSFRLGFILSLITAGSVALFSFFNLSKKHTPLK